VDYFYGARQESLFTMIEEEEIGESGFAIRA